MIINALTFTANGMKDLWVIPMLIGGMIALTVIANGIPFILKKLKKVLKKVLTN